jgi:PPIC-type PPIASE domain
VAVRGCRCLGFGTWRAIVLAVVLAVGLGLSGCGGAQPSPIVVRVGSALLDKRSVEHWTSVITRGAITANVASPGQQPLQRALALLIHSQWLIGEASRVGLRPSRQQLGQEVQGQERSMPNGRAEFQELLASSGETLADVEFEARARWAATALARRLHSAAANLARAQASASAIARFYRAHAARFHRRERRYYDLIERIPRRAAAVALARRLGTGRRFAEKASKEEPFRPKSFDGLPGQGVVYRAVFAARVGVLTGPLPLQGAYALFVLRRIEPPRVQPLAEVRGSIERRLLALAERRAVARLIADFHRRWLEQTDCRPGYVIYKCRQYRGPQLPERDPFAGY